MMHIKLTRKVPERFRPVVAAGTHLFHVTYLGAATMELHGIYSMAAGGLLGFVVIGIITGFGGE